MKPHAVAKTAYERGYGTFQEIVPVADNARLSYKKENAK